MSTIESFVWLCLIIGMCGGGVLVLGLIELLALLLMGLYEDLTRFWRRHRRSVGSSDFIGIER